MTALFRIPKSSRAAFAIAAIGGVMACDNLVAPGARSSIKYRYGDYLLPIAAIHVKVCRSAADNV